MRALLIHGWLKCTAIGWSQGKQSIRLFSSPAPVREEGGEGGDSQADRAHWLTLFEQFQRASSSVLPKDWISTSFSRSSGPGGQNVNKLNTKAEVRLNLSIAAKEQVGIPFMSKEVIRYLTRKSPYYVASTHSLLISSMKTRTQSGNLQDAMEKMQQHLQVVLAQDIAGETSAEQRSKVKSLIAKDKARTRRSKEKRGAVKKDRKSGHISFDF